MKQSLEDWKRAILTLDEQNFFDLMRGYLGNIRTPFSKQRLIEDLSGFLMRPDIQQRVASLLDDTDRKICAAICQLDVPTPRELGNFFGEEISWADLYTQLLNLEERLIVYRFDDAGIRRLAINPLFYELLRPVCENPALLYPSVPIKAPLTHHEETLDILSLAAGLSWLEHSAASSASAILKANGQLKKHISAKAEALFGPERPQLLTDSLTELGLASFSSHSFSISEVGIHSFSKLNNADRQLYLAAALCAVHLRSTKLNSPSAPIDAEEYLLYELDGDTKGADVALAKKLRRERLQQRATCFRDFLQTLPNGRAWTAETLYRILDTVERAWAETARRRWEAADIKRQELYGSGSPTEFRAAAIQALVDCGLLLHLTQDDLYTRAAEAKLPESVPPAAEQTAQGTPAAIHVDASFSVSVHPTIPCEQLFLIARLLELREFGKVLRFELTRESVARAFDRGYTAESLKGLLEELSLRPLPQNLRWTLGDWGHRHQSVALYSGDVLVLAEDRRYLMNSPELQDLMQRQLAEGVWLLQRGSAEEAQQLLSKAGADMIARPKTQARLEASGSSASSTSSRFPALNINSSSSTKNRSAFITSAELADKTPKAAAEPSPAPAPAPASASAELPDPAALKASLKAELKKRPLSREQNMELENRIQRRVILDERQLVGEAVRWEKLEARALDYVGKVRIAEQAIAQNGIVELRWNGPDGSSQHTLGHARHLQKGGKEAVFSIEQMDDSGRLSLELGKISLLRRIKRSMFGD